MTSPVLLACLAEATAAKPGNVHPQASFGDLTHADFVTAAHISTPILETATNGIGPAIEQATVAVHEATGTNVNLGICLLLAPLVAVPNTDWPDVTSTLASLTVADAEAVYRAIRLASPGGLGDAPDQDVAEPPTVTLREAMAKAASWDGIARLYATDFADLFSFAVPTLQADWQERDVETAVVRLAVHWHARFPDTHIARRCGEEIAADASRRAREVVADWTQLATFDRWLRADGHRRNPGTTADIVAAAIYALVRNDTAFASDVERWLRSKGADVGTSTT